jgi:hypothetical protein
LNLSHNHMSHWGLIQHFPSSSTVLNISQAPVPSLFRCLVSVLLLFFPRESAFDPVDLLFIWFSFTIQLVIIQFLPPICSTFLTLIFFFAFLKSDTHIGSYSTVLILSYCGFHLVQNVF